MKHYKWILAACMLLLVVSCGTVQHTTTPYYNYDTECRGTSQDGVLQLTAWGKGTTRKEAVPQAKKQALNDVLFQGIGQGNNESAAIPLVIDPHAKKIHEDYFLNFFSSKGSYTAFVKVHSPHCKSIRKYKNYADKMYRVYVDVDRAALKRQLIEDGIINKETR